MGLRVNNNVAAMNSYRNLTATESQMSKSLEKLSSGFRINRAADDAAGLAISEQLRSQVGGLKVAQRNAQDGISVIQTAEGALTEVHSLLQRVRDLAVQAANTGANDSTSREQAAKEVQSALTEIDRIASATKFGGKTLLAGETAADGTVTPSKFTFQVGSEADAVNQIDVDIKAMNVKGLSLNAADVSVESGTAITATNLVAAQSGLKIDLTKADGSVLSGALDITLGTAGQGLGAVTVADLENTDAAVAAAALATANQRLNKVIEGTDLKGQVKAELVQVASGTAGASTWELKLTTVDASLDTTLKAYDEATTAAPNAAFGFAPAATAASATTAESTTGLKGLIEAGKTSAITKIDAAIKEVSAQRGDLGAYQNRLEHTIANLAVTTENLSASESRIRDTDMAQEMTNYTRSQILVQAGTAMLAQANSSSQGVLSLLRG